MRNNKKEFDSKKITSICDKERYYLELKFEDLINIINKKQDKIYELTKKSNDFNKEFTY